MLTYTGDNVVETTLLIDVDIEQDLFDFFSQEQLFCSPILSKVFE